MTAPNIRTITSMTGKTAVQEVSTVNTAIVTNSASSNTVIKLNALYISNIDGTNSADISVDVFRDSNSFFIVRTLTVPADSSVDLFSKSIYLEEGDSLRLVASANNDLQAVCSYEVIS